jgi:hypothetical protein
VVWPRTDNVSVLLVQFLHQQMVLSSKSGMEPPEAGDTCKEWTREFGQWVEGRESIYNQRECESENVDGESLKEFSMQSECYGDRR